MGLLAHTSFETREGVSIASVYIRIVSLSCEFRGYNTALTIVYESYLNREKRMQGRAVLYAPTLAYRTYVTVPYTTAYGTLEFLYGVVKDSLTEAGIATEDVLEPGQSPSTYSEPTAETDS